MRAPTRRPTRRIPRPNGRRPHTPECFALWDVRVSVLQIAMVYGPAQPDLTKLVPYVTLAFCAASTAAVERDTVGRLGVRGRCR